MSVYLDHNATTALKPVAKAAMLAALDVCGNASSVHSHGRAARATLERARGQIAAFAGAPDSKGVIFTSGATEANSTILQAFKGQRTLISGIEHPSVYESSPDALRIPVLSNGLVDLDALEGMLEGAKLVSVMLVNNETGVIQPVARIAQMAHAAGALMHVDAVQAGGRMAIHMGELGADYLTLSSHKMGGPMGVGAIVAAPRVPPVKLIFGGGQERRQRAGTENVPAIAAFGAVAQSAMDDLVDYQRLSVLRDDMEARLKVALPQIVFFGNDAPRVANTSCFAMPGALADMQLMALDLAGYSVSSGSACSSGSVKPSHVLEAMGVAPELASCALRVSFGWNTQPDEVVGFVKTYLELSQNWIR